MRECKVLKIVPKTGVSMTQVQEYSFNNGQSGIRVHENPGIETIINQYLSAGWTIAGSRVLNESEVTLLLTR